MEQYSTQLFVYGTLKKDFPLHGHLKNSAFVCEDAIMGFVMYDLGAFPAIVHMPEYTTLVHGEIYWVTDEVLATIDSIEGVPYMYRRMMIDTYFKKIPVEVYLFPDMSVINNGKLISDGIWKH